MQLQGTVQKDLILSSFMYETFLDDAARFLVSARQFCPPETTDIVMVVRPEVDPKFAQFAHELQVQLVPAYSAYEDVNRNILLKTLYRGFLLALEWGTSAGLPGFDRAYRMLASAWVHPTSTRHFAYLDFIKANPNYRCVLLSDSRDVVFQGNPFPEVNPQTLSVFEHDPSVIYGHEDDFYGGVDTKWTAKMFGNQVVNNLNGKRIICAGTIMGSPKVMQQYLTYMEKEILSHKSNTIDQSIHNKLIYLDLPGSLFQIHSNVSGPILTLHAIDEQSYDIQDQQVMVNGKVVPVLHQYDRVPDLKNLFINLYPITATA